MNPSYRSHCCSMTLGRGRSREGQPKLECSSRELRGLIQSNSHITNLIPYC